MMGQDITSVLITFSLSISGSGCGVREARVTQPRQPRPEAEDICLRRVTAEQHRSTSPFAEFCRTQGSDPKLERHMTEILVGGGAEAGHFSIRCRADICSVKCVTVPREQCVAELHNAGKWSGNEILYGMGFQDDRGQAMFRFLSDEYLSARPARQDVVSRIARRLHDSAALQACKQNASAHGLLLLYIEVPQLGSPTVTASGEISDTADAECVRKALMGAVVDERVTAPLSTRDLPIAVNL
jgi:hypothetical protein